MLKTQSPRSMIACERAAIPGTCKLRERRREHEQRRGEDRRDGAGRVHLERQVRRLPAVDAPPDVAAASR